VITNGFDPEELTGVRAAHFDDFAVVYAGTFYQGKRTITPLLSAIVAANRKLKANERSIRLHYFGCDESHVREVARRMAASQLCVLHGLVPRTQSLEAQRGADVVAVITSVLQDASLADLGIVTGKLYEALGLQSRVLLIAPRGSDARRIVSYANAGRSFTGLEVESIAEWLVQVNRTDARRPAVGAEAFSWPVIALKAHQYLTSRLHAGAFSQMTHDASGFPR